MAATKQRSRRSPDVMNGQSRPDPDPTVMTTEQLDRTVNGLHEWVEGQLSIRDERLHAIDRATDLRMDALPNISSEIDAKVKHLQELFNERFSSVNQQFVERDVRSDQQAAASAQALAAALQAAKELVGAQGEASAAAAVKSETSFTKQIDQIGTIIQTLEKALDARITELKERIDRGEGSDKGFKEAHIEQREVIIQNRGGMNVWIAVAGLVFTFMFLLIGIISVYAAVKK